MIWRSIVFGSVLYLSVSCATKRSWNYEILSVTASSSDENLLNVSVQIDRLSFSESGISGTFDLKFDTDDNTTLQVLFFYSVSGREEDYYETPYKTPKLRFKNFIDDYYKDLTYANLGECSNLPKLDGKYVDPWPRRTYILRSCKLTGDGFPYFLASGYYKVLLRMLGQVEFDISCIVKVTPKVI